MNSNRVLVLIFLFSIKIFAQTERFVPDSTSLHSLWKIPSSTQLYVGASFYYIDPKDSIIVWLDTSESDKIGDLYMMIPGFTDSAIYLFSNIDVGKRINVTSLLAKAINPGTEIFFKYKRKDAEFDKFTGQNRKGIDPIDKSAYPGADFVSREFDRRPGFGYRWSAAGRIQNTSDIPSDTVIFGFEDMINFFDPNDTLVISDRDFNDVIFRVTGLKLNVEKTLDSLELNIPNSATAGDSVLCKAKVWFDSSGHKITNNSLNSLLRFKLIGRTINHDSLVNWTTPDAALFVPRTAFETFTICVSLIDSVSGDTLLNCKNIIVNPGSPAFLSVELRSDTNASDFSLNHMVQIPGILISSNNISKNIYAVFRDMFGNFAGFSTSTQWDTTSISSTTKYNSGCITVRNGRLTIGEAVVEKIKSGNMIVTAVDTVKSKTLKDSILVTVSAASYDSLRIGSVGNTSTNYISSLRISTDSCAFLTVQGRRIDNSKWETVKVTWFSNKWNINTGNNTYSILEFCPGDTGNGIIEVLYDNFLKTKLSVNAKPGLPHNLRIFSAMNNVFPNDTFASAGKNLQMTAKIFDKHNVWLKNVLFDSIMWTLKENSLNISDTSAILENIRGENNSLFPIKAYRTVRVSARYGELSDSTDISIIAGPPYRVVIESHADWQKSIHKPDEIDTLEIPDNATTTEVFALLRDSLGNYIDSLRQGTWTAKDTIISIHAGNSVCHGMISKNLNVINGTSALFVSNGTLSDTAYVKLLPYHYTAVRITNSRYESISTLTMSTNDDTLLRVQGLRSDTSLWRDIPANWSKTDSLHVDPECPVQSSTYFFSPVKPGKGILTVQYGKISNLTDTVNVVFTRGEPVSAEFHFITPPEKRIAGDTIYAIVNVLNKDGLLPGEYCFDSTSESGFIYYTDTLGYGNSSMTPIIFTSSNMTHINKPGTKDFGLQQCFSNGQDTVGMVFYYAPFTRDSLHRMTINFSRFTSNSNPFRILPSALASLSLSHTNNCCADTLFLRFPDDQALIYSIGYDKYGNMRGSELCNWHTTGSLHPCDTINVLTRILYSADSSVVKDDESGFLIARSEQAPAISDSLPVVIIGPLAKPFKAVTRDLNGNGTLDQIIVNFDMPVYKNSSNLLNFISVDYNYQSLPVDSFFISKDSFAITLFLHEDTSQLQTNWTPLISLHNTDFALGGAIDSFTIEAEDGAGPVIKSVIKEIKTSNHKNDIVTVLFSEQINGPHGNQISYITMPENVFHVYLISSAGVFTEIPSLKGIGNFNASGDYNSVAFTTSNGNNLSTSNYVNLKTDKDAYIIQDLFANKPSQHNRKAKVEVRGNVITEICIAPNPTRPTLTRQKPGEFHFKHNPQTLEWIINDNAGVAIIFPIKLSELKDTKIGGQVIIQDMMGNTVIADPETDFKWVNLFNEKAVVSNQKRKNVIPTTWNADESVYEYMIYWNGYTKDRHKAAPGVYRVTLKLFNENGKKDKVNYYIGKIGLKP